MDKTDLLRCLDQSLAFAPTYGPGYSNHLPMALHAAWELGAEGERLAAQARREAGHLEPAQADASTAQDWRELLGHRDADARLRALMHAEIDKQGAEAVLRERMPLLISSPHAALFHGMIRTAHAFESGHPGELAAALASWAGAWSTLPGGTAVAAMKLADWQQALQHGVASGQERLRGERLLSVARGPDYAALCDALAPETHWALRREQLLSMALDAYLESRNFVVLHLITGLRALRVLAPFVPDWPDVQTWLTRAFTAAWLASGLEQRPRMQAEAPGWPALHRAALAQCDDHVLKLVHACWQEDRLQPDRRWRQAAALAIEAAAAMPAV